MLQPPDIAEELILSRVRDAYGLPAIGAAFLPIGADLDTAAYLVDAGARYFAKLRRGRFEEASVAIPRLLADQGARQSLAPIMTKSGELHTGLETFTLILYPFVKGVSAFAATLGETQWVELGLFVRRLHGLAVPSRLKVPHETWSQEGRESVTGFLERFAGRSSGDPVAAQLAALLEVRRDDIRRMVERAGELAEALRRRTLARVLCHADLHAGNVLVTDDGGFYVVDWDEPLLAPRERDLMFFGAGVGGVWNKPAEQRPFYRGYGPVEVDARAIAYYRYERIVQDVAVVCRHVFLSGRRDDDRGKGLEQLARQFLPDGVLAVADRTWEML